MSKTNLTSDTITNWYTKIPKSFQKSDVDKTYAKHLIKNNSMILFATMIHLNKFSSI